MRDIVGERLKKQVRARRRNRMQYILLYAFISVNGVYIISQLIKPFI